MIGILSDSHDNVDMVREAARLFRAAGCDLVIHAGDFVAPFTARELSAAGCPVAAVFGNCDGEKAGLRRALEPFGSIQEGPRVLEQAGRRILVTHLDGAVARYAAEGACDLLVYGHTHRGEIRAVGKTLIVNPGETGGWVTKKSTIALYDPAANTAELLPLA